LYVSSAGASDIWIDWVDNSMTESGFYIEHCTDGVNWTEIDTVAADVTTYRHSGLLAGPHYYRVRAYSSTTGNSTYSNQISYSL
jgi:titin